MKMSDRVIISYLLLLSMSISIQKHYVSDQIQDIPGLKNHLKSCTDLRVTVKLLAAWWLDPSSVWISEFTPCLLSGCIIPRTPRPYSLHSGIFVIHEQTDTVPDWRPCSLSAGFLFYSLVLSSCSPLMLQRDRQPPSDVPTTDFVWSRGCWRLFCLSIDVAFNSSSPSGNDGHADWCFFRNIYWKSYNCCSKTNVNISAKSSDSHSGPPQIVLCMWAQPQTLFLFLCPTHATIKTKSHRRQSRSLSFMHKHVVQPKATDFGIQMQSLWLRPVTVNSSGKWL